MIYTQLSWHIQKRLHKEQPQKHGCCVVLWGFFKIFEALLLLTRTKTHISSFDYSGIMNYNHEWYYLMLQITELKNKNLIESEPLELP